MPSLYAPMNGVNTKQKSVYGLMSGVNTKQKNGYELMSGVNTKIFSSEIKWTYEVHIVNGSEGAAHIVDVLSDYSVKYQTHGTDGDYYIDTFDVLFTFESPVRLSASNSILWESWYNNISKMTQGLYIDVNGAQIASKGQYYYDSSNPTLGSKCTQTINLGAEANVSTLRFRCVSTSHLAGAIGYEKITLRPAGGTEFLLNNSGISQ